MKRRLKYCCALLDKLEKEIMLKAIYRSDRYSNYFQNSTNHNNVLIHMNRD